jgi:hypothetical protein
MLILLGLSATSMFLYLLFNLSGWLKQARGAPNDNSPRRAYLVGLLFAGIFYYGFPIWWWRYGLANTVKLFVMCLGAGAICQAILRGMGTLEVNDFGMSLAFAQIIAVPIRAIAGTWIAKNDARWRGAIALRRKP